MTDLHYFQVTLPGSRGHSLLFAGGPAITAKAGMLDLTRPNGQPMLTVPEGQVRELTAAEFETLLAEDARRGMAHRARRN